MSQDSLVAFGSNLGDSDRCYCEISRMWQADPRFDSVTASSLITTEPVGTVGQQNRYRNGCFRFQFSRSPEDLFETLIQMEQTFGRVRRRRWGARTVDLDLLLYGDVAMTTQSLEIPHPRLTFRRFVLQPACEIAGEMIHPHSGLTMNQHLQVLDSRPNRIALVTAEGEELSELIQQAMADFEASGWQFQIVSDVGEIHNIAEKVKLLVYSCHLSPELIATCQRFRGATLDAGADDGSLDLSELAAAIEAMARW